VRLADLNALEDDEAVRAFLRCCGSSQWARRMAAARPFASVEAMAVDADATWRALDRVDWLEAFARILKSALAEWGGLVGPGTSGRRCGGRADAPRAGGR